MISDQLITGLAVVLGAGMGAGSTLVATHLQYRQKIRLELAKETRKRAVEAAERCQIIFSQLSGAVEKQAHLKDRPYPDPDRDEAIRQENYANMRLSTQFLYLPTAYRKRLETLRDALQWSSDLSTDSASSTGYHYGTSAYRTGDNE